ncbi:unnamed protein product [Aureobasidium vineae]|uniref:C2H2-type domain-containing protein n=1 Tax=Aureobasidium vineae TaxID=2773715 RepID=A0A9N8JMT6_9PEZI|nr:unnamed protein product [Aureobasidium vineae]
MTNACATHEHILEMSQFMTQCTALNPPVLEAYTSSYSLIERRQFTDMMQLANHMLFLAQMQTGSILAGQVQRSIESWVVRGDPMPNQFIYETAELFASVDYRFHVMQWDTREQASDAMVSASNRDTEDPMDTILDSFRIQEAYPSFTPWAMNNHPGTYHDTNEPPLLSPHRVSVYKTDIKAHLNCIDCPSCSFSTKVKRDMLAHEALHWDPQPCECAQSNQKALAAGIDTIFCSCDKLTTDETARMLRNWEDETTGHLIRKFGRSEVMRKFSNTTAIQMQSDVTVPDIHQSLAINSQGGS